MIETVKQLQVTINAHLPRLMDFVALARADKPIGVYLLLWPTLCALWIAAEGWPGWPLFLVFSVGTLLTRSAGCIVNDLADMKFDGQVRRTAARPLIAGRISRSEALILAACLLLVALLLVLTTNIQTVGLAALAVIIAGIYPFMKRYTYLPQAVLGIAFSMGILMAFTAVSGSINNEAWLLLIANLLWVVAYDTQYAMVDREDDLRLGIKSTAILFADLDRLMIGLLQVSFIFSLLLLTRSVELSISYYLSLAAASGLLVYQQYLIRHRDRDACFEAFLNNHWVGLSVFIGIASHYTFFS